MPVLLFSLRGVPEDEAFEVRELLTEHDINFYETSAGNWGISMPALWLHNNSQLPEAEQLLAEYQHQRSLTQRQLYLERKQAGQQQNVLKNFLQKPLLYLLSLGMVSLILYVSIRLLFEIGLHL